MKWVLNASRLGGWDFAAIAALAKDAGYDAVELGASADDSQFTSTNVLLSDLTKVRGIFDAAGVEIAALASSMAIAPGRESFAEEIGVILDAARRLGAGIVRIQHRGAPRSGRVREVSNAQLMAAADVAAERKIRIVVDNAPEAASINQIWELLERLGHPAIGCSLNLLNATLAGQSPYQTVPMMNQKILYTEVADARLDGAGVKPCKLGEGNVPAQDFLTRLRGIGYGGCVALELRDDSTAEEIARDGILKSREWAQPTEPAVAGRRRSKKRAH
jgi:sugar phosphate isomerase/epimerase